MLQWSTPPNLVSGNGFKPQISFKPDGSYLITSQRNEIGISVATFDRDGKPYLPNHLYQPAYNGDPIDGHYAAWSADTLHLFYTPSNPRRLLYRAGDGSPIDFGKTYFGDTFAVFNDNAVCSDGRNLYVVVKKYGNPDQIVIFENLWDKFAEIGRYQATKTPRICAKGELIASFARNNQSEPAQSQFSCWIMQNRQVRTEIINLPGEEINGGMECATNGVNVMFGFARDDIRLYLWQDGKMQAPIVLNDVGDIAGDGLDIVPMPDGGYCVMWNDKTTTKAYYALENEGWTKRVLWDLGGSASTTLEAEAVNTGTRIVWAAVGGSNRALYQSSAEIKAKEYKVMFTGGTITGVEAVRILDTRPRH